jgi:hypothetical protein
MLQKASLRYARINGFQGGFGDGAAHVWRSPSPG